MSTLKKPSEALPLYRRRKAVQKEYLPPLFERFCDWPVLHDEDEVIASVAAEIELILNTRLTYTEIDKEEYKGHLPLLFFGLNDLSNSLLGNRISAMRLIKRAIYDYEPRVRAIELTTFEWSKSHEALHIEITCDVLFGAKWKRVTFPVSLRQPVSVRTNAVA